MPESLLPFVRFVRTNMKVGATVALGPKTVIVGRNGSGKSTILQSIELATCGYASDMEGRNQVKQKAALQRLFPNGVDPDVECTLSDGTVFSWSARRKVDGNLDEVKHVQPVGVRWAVQELRGVLGSESTAVAAWLEQQVLGSLTTEELLATLPPEVHPEVKMLLKRHRASRLDFIDMAKNARDEAKTLRAQATRSEKTLQQMTTGVSPTLVDADRAQLEARLRGLNAARQGGVTHAEYAAMKAELDVMVDDYLQKQGQAAQLPQVEAQVGAALDKLRATLQVHRLHSSLGLEGCWVCGVGTNEQVDHQAREINKVFEELASTHADAVRRTGLEREVSALEIELKVRADRLNSVSLVEDTQAEANSIRVQIASDDAAKRIWLNATAVRMEVAQLRAKADHLSTASKALMAVGETHLVARKAAFEQDVSGFLPPGELVGIDLDSARVGLVRAGQFHSALAGAEGSRVLMALASVARHEGGPCIIAPEDRAWDPMTLGAVMKALTASSAQVIIMSTVMPVGVEGGWVVLDLNEHRSSAGST